MTGKSTLGEAKLVRTDVESMVWKILSETCYFSLRFRFFRRYFAVIGWNQDSRSGFCRCRFCASDDMATPWLSMKRLGTTALRRCCVVIGWTTLLGCLNLRRGQIKVREAMAFIFLDSARRLCMWLWPGHMPVPMERRTQWNVPRFQVHMCVGGSQ